MKLFSKTIALCLVLWNISYLNAEDLPKVVVFATGGTIAEKVDPSAGGEVPALSGQALLKAVPELSQVARIKTPDCALISSGSFFRRSRYELTLAKLKLFRAFARSVGS